jgi:hypothetical protein
MDSHTLTILAFGWFIAFTLTLLALCWLIVFLFQYQSRTSQEMCLLNRELGLASGELRGLKNQEIRYLTSKKRRFFRLVDVFLYLESHDGRFTRVIGATNDLGSFPELSAEDIAAIRQFVAAGISVAGTLAGAASGAPVLH